jgi:RNA polymerase sigma factor (TIGR02999 family)
MNSSPQEIAQLLRAWREGDQAALDQLLPLVYDELRRIAHRYLARHSPGATLQTTALIHEVYLRLTGKQIEWQDRAHFMGFCATVMRNVLIDHFRRRRPQVSLSEAETLPQSQNVDVLRLHDALNDLAQLNARQSRVVELKFFGGLTTEEVAEVLQIGTATVKRDWQEAKRWLYRELSKGGAQ